MDAENIKSQFFVYLYSDERGRVRYVGYRRETARASSHLAGSHNDKLNRFLATSKYRLEIAGPFDSEQTGRAVETALISALKPDLNVDPGESRWRFRPLGVPLAYADRPTEAELVLDDFLALQVRSLFRSFSSSSQALILQTTGPVMILRSPLMTTSSGSGWSVGGKSRSSYPNGLSIRLTVPACSLGLVVHLGSSLLSARQVSTNQLGPQPSGKKAA